MFFVYLKVLGPGQLHLSCIRLADGLLQHHGVVVSVGLHARLVVHVGDVLPTGGGSHLIRPGLKSFFRLEIPLHTKPMYPFIISIKDLPNENVVRERLTQNSASTRSCLLRYLLSGANWYLSHV